MSSGHGQRDQPRPLTDRLIARARGTMRAGRRRLARLGYREPPVCHDLESWTASYRGAQRWVIDPPFTISRRLPLTIEPEIDPSFADHTPFAVPERALVKIPAARIRGEVGLVILPTGEFVGEVVALTDAGQRSLLRGQDAYSTPLPKRSEDMPGNYYAVLGLGVRHYYHWSHDLIMRMRGIADRLPADTRLIVPERMQPFQTETLGLLGLDEHPRVPFPNGGFWQLENLYVVTPLLKAQIDSSEPYRWFRERARERYGITPAPPDRRFYLTRKYDDHWRTTNEDEVEAFLSEHGFETVAPGRMSFRDQIELFGQAEMIVGTGAGLFNMVFAPPGVKVLQLQETAHIELALWTMADAMGIEYHYVVGDAVPNSEHANVDIHVPIEKLAASLHAMTATRAT